MTHGFEHITTGYYCIADIGSYFQNLKKKNDQQEESLKTLQHGIITSITQIRADYEFMLKDDTSNFPTHIREALKHAVQKLKQMEKQIKHKI